MGSTESHKNLVIGIGGISRSGKTTLSKSLKKHYGCPVFHNDMYFTAGLLESDPEIQEGLINHWESTVICNLQGFYEDLLNAAYDTTINKTGIVIVEGHLLYNRQDIVNLIDIKIMRNISKDEEKNRLRKLRPHLVKNDKFYDKIMWDEWVLQNNLFDTKKPNCYEISAMLDPDLVFKDTVKLIDDFKAKYEKDYSIFKNFTFPFETTDSSNKCIICNINAHRINPVFKPKSCDHFFHADCFKKIFNEYLENLYILREKTPLKCDPLKCPCCSHEFDDYFIQHLGNLHNYKKALLSDDILIRCNFCKTPHWQIKGHNIISYACSNCVLIYFIFLLVNKSTF